jgi:hypothetical protein
VLACIAFSQQSNSFSNKKQYSRGGAMIAAAAAASKQKKVNALNDVEWSKSARRPDG